MLNNMIAKGMIIHGLGSAEGAVAASSKCMDRGFLMDTLRQSNKLGRLMCNFVRLFALVGAVAWISGCASVSVSKVEPAAQRPCVPDTIYVRDFRTPKSAFRVDRGGTALVDFRKDFSRMLTFATTDRIESRMHLHAVDVPGDAVLPRKVNAWLLTGRFVHVNQGSRALRTVIGFGLGATKLETEVTVYDMSVEPPRPFLTFMTTGGSNAQPGVIPGFPINFVLVGLDTAGHLAIGLKMDVIRTSREIVAVLSEYMAHQGFIPSHDAYRAKRLGTWP